MTLSRRGVKKLWNHAHIPMDSATTARSPFTVLRTAPGDRGIFPRANKQSTGLFVAPVCGLVPPFQIRPHQQKRTPIRMDGCSFLAEKEGFEPSKPFWGLHDFQSCALGQLRDFSIPFLSSSVATDWVIIQHSSLFVNTFLKNFKIIFSG